ncbi:MAG TPA: ribonuclease H family protein [Candidatus Dormibacteraeota bacterium]|nr:ribonuclease H family protein [Candidatus Dormibacteraeota bacterium]
MTKKSKITSESSLKASIGAFWGSKRADKSSAYNFYGSYLAYKKEIGDGLAMKLAAINRTWVHNFYKKKSHPKKMIVTSGGDKTNIHKRKLDKITINTVQTADQLKYYNNKTTVFVDAGTKNNGKKGEQETRIACVDGNDELVFDEFISDCTNNQGEIRAILEALRRASDDGQSLNIYSDSTIAVGWAMRGITRNSIENDTYALETKKLLEKTNSLISWVPREINLAGIYLEDHYTI